MNRLAGVVVVLDLLSGDEFGVAVADLENRFTRLQGVDSWGLVSHVRTRLARWAMLRASGKQNIINLFNKRYPMCVFTSFFCSF